MEAAKLLGHVLSQDSVMAVSQEPFKGGEKVGTITTFLPPDSGFEFVEDVYNQLWQLERDGKKLVGGHTTANGQMLILNYSSLPTRGISCSN